MYNNLFSCEVVIEEGYDQLLCNATNWFPIGWAEVRPKHYSTYFEKDFAKSMKEVPMTSGWCLKCWKQDLAFLACIAMSWFGKKIHHFHLWVRRLTKTVPNVQSSLAPTSVEVMRMIGVEYLVGCLAAIKQVYPFSFFNKVVLWCE